MRFINKSLIGALVLFLIGWAPAQVKNKEERGSRAKVIRVEPSLLGVNLKATTGNPGKSKYPLSESFESTFPPYGWTVVTNGAAGNNGWQQTLLQAHTGTYSVYHNDDNADCSSWLISPSLYISDTDTLLSFWQFQNYGSYIEYHGIWVDTTAGTDTTNFFELQSLSAGIEDTWEEVQINLSAFVGDTITIAFKYQGYFADEWYIDDVSGPEVVLPDTVGPAISIIKAPSHHFYTGVGDSVFASITDPSGVSGADLYYSVDLGTSWNSIPMTNVTGDTFVAIIPVVDRGSKVAWYILAQDNSGNSSISGTYVYNIMPSGENLIVYSTGDELSPYMQAIWATGIEPSPDIMYSGDVPTYADSLPLWTTIYWGEISSLSDGEQNALINFLKSGTGSDRKHLIISGDDIGYYEHETEFYNFWLRARHIKDDLSSSTDNDTIVGITGDGISDGMPQFTVSSGYPDMVEPYSPYGDMDISWKFLIATTGDSVNTAGGLAYNGLTYIAEYLPYEISEIDSQKYVDTLILRIHNFNSTAGLPPIADWANTQWPPSTTVNVGDSTELIFGQIWEPGLTDVGSDINKDSIRAQLGFGPDGSIPYEEETLWTWIDARFNVIAGNNYEYMARIHADSSLQPGHYDYCFRYSIKEGGVWGPWIYADLNGTGTKGKAYNYNYDPSQAGDLVVQKGYPILTIPEIQDTTGTGSDASAHEGDTVATFGIVTGVYSNGFFLEEKPAVPWGGIWVYMSPPTVSVGDSIYIEGVVSEYYGLTELKDIQDLEVLASGVSLPDPITVTTGEANDEQYEGVLLSTKGICTDPDLGYGEWQIDDGTGPLRVDDMGLAFTPDSGIEYAITAPLYYSFGNFKLEPRDSSDIMAYAYTRVKINEVYYDSPGADQGLFVELYGPPGMPLDNMMLVGINGANGLIYETVDLSGDTIPPDGFFVAAQDTTVPNYDKITGVDWQNGPDNIQLWYIDGPDTIIVDAIGYGDSDTTTWVFRGEGLPAPDVWGGRSLVRFPDGKDTDNNSLDFHPTIYRTPGLPNKIAIFFDDFEAGTGNWIGDWENTAEDAYSGDSSYTDTANANYPNNANIIGQLADPLDLSEYPSYTLEFWTKHYIEDGWDFGYVEVSTDSANWTKIDSLTGDSVNWYPVSLDLSAFAGDSTVWIRFRLESDTYVNEAGWFVDDVAVIANLSDNSPPLISHTRPPYPPEGQTSAIGDITITTTILDYSPIAADTLYYNVDGGSITAAPHDSVVTDSLGNVIYYYTIPAQPSGALVTYYFTAVDTAGNSATTPTYRYYAGELISYDDGDPGYFAYVPNTDTLAVQFGSTLVDTFTRVTSVLFYFYNAVGTDSFYVHVWDANGNDVVAPILAYQDTSNPNLSWTVVDLRPYEIYIFPGTDLYVGYTTIPGDSVPAILFDSPASFYHSYLLQSGTWQLINSDLFIRVLTEKTTEVHEGLTTLPKVFMLGPNYPNPFRGQTVIKYALPKDAHVTLEIYDISGRKVKTLVNGFEKAGWKTAIWNGTNERGEKVKSGIYFYRMKADKFLKTRKMVYLK